jgi:homoserine kinase
MVCGFDILGYALQAPYDIYTLTIRNEKGIKIIQEDAFDLPANPEENDSGAALLAFLEAVPEIPGLILHSKKNIKPGSGIGSSAASAAGVVVAANHLINNYFPKEELVRFAMFGEKVASGVKHADNIAPAIYGGVTLIRSIFPLDIIPIQAPDLYVTIVHPQIEIRTADARQILKQNILLKDAIKQWGNIAGLVAGLIHHDYDLIGRSLEDVIIESVRSILIPGFNEIKIKCNEAGALGGGISCSGPSIFMLSTTLQIANSVEQIMQEVYNQIGLAYNTYVTTINHEGVRILDSK